MTPDLEVYESKKTQIEALSIQEHGPRMLKPSNSSFWDPKTSNSEVLTSWSHLSGWVDAKSFDLRWPPDLEVWEFKNIWIEVVIIQEHGPRMLKPSNLMFWAPQTSNSNVLTSLGHLPGWIDAKSFDLGWSPDLEN